MRIVRDVLDKKLLDVDRHKMGCVDGIVLEFPDGRQPRMVRLEMGGEILAARVAHWLEKPVKWIARRWGPRRPGIIAIEWKHVTQMGRDIHLDISADATDALAWEHWVAEHIIGRIPGSGK